jgi:hypothetical protein
MTVGRLVGSRNPISIALSGTDAGKVYVPYEAGLFGHRDGALLLLVGVVTPKQADLDAGGVFRSDREVHPGAVPRRAERIRLPR